MNKNAIFHRSVQQITTLINYLDIESFSDQAVLLSLQLGGAVS